MILKKLLKSLKFRVIGGVVLLGIVILGAWFFTHGQQANDRASELYQAGDVAAASAEYKKLLAQFGGNSETWNRYGNTLRDLKKYDEADQAYRQAIKLDKTNHSAYRNLSYLAVDQEQVRKQAGKIDEAIGIIADGFDTTGKNSIYLAEDLLMLYSEKGDQAQIAKWKAIREDLLAKQ